MEVYATIILMVFIVSVLAWINTLFSYLLDYCFWDGSIFQSYLPWLAEMNLDIIEWNEVQMLPKEQRKAEYINRAQSKFFYKVLGGCIVCTNVWLSFGTFFVLSMILNIEWYYIIPYTVSSSFFLRKIIGH